MAISGISAGAGLGYQGLSQLQGLQVGQGQGQTQGQGNIQTATIQTGGPATPPANPQNFQIQGPSKPATGTETNQSTVQEARTGTAQPGQAGAGIGDLQAVAPSSVGRGQIVDISA